MNISNLLNDLKYYEGKDLELFYRKHEEAIGYMSIALKRKIYEYFIENLKGKIKEELILKLKELK